jgi:hypothetical protein
MSRRHRPKKNGKTLTSERIILWNHSSRLGEALVEVVVVVPKVVADAAVAIGRPRDEKVDEAADEDARLQLEAVQRILRCHLRWLTMRVKKQKNHRSLNPPQWPQLEFLSSVVFALPRVLGRERRNQLPLPLLLSARLKHPLLFQPRLLLQGSPSQ